MFRKSALAMALVGVFASRGVLALGLGDIKLESALNQPLRAEVSLLSATDDELQGLKVGIAPPEAFDKAGIDRPAFLSKLRFTVARTPDGEAVIRITSRDSIREPFLDFLLEVIWANGKLLREYTLLVDPPVTMAAPAPRPVAPVAAAPAPRTAPAPGRPAPSAPVTGADVGQISGDTYGPVGRNDTLWTIAEQVRPDRDVSMEQTMLALLEANPQAFFKDNINNLKAGYVLRIPSREEMLALSRGEALAEVRMQNTEWREGRERPARVAEGPAPVVAPPEAKLELVTPQGEPTAGTGLVEGEGAEFGTLRKELVLATEAAEAQAAQTAELESRLAALEEQISKMQRLIELKDDELALLRAQTGEAPGEMPEVGAPAVAEAPGLEMAEDEAGAATDADALEAELFGEVDQASLGAEDSPLADEPMAEEAAVEEPAAEMPTPEPEPLVAPEPTAETQPFKESQSLLDRLLANPIWLATGGAVLLLLILLIVRRRSASQPEFEESILQERAPRPTRASAPVVEPEPVAKAPVAAADEAATAEAESSLLSEFATSDLGAIQNQSEADPLAEADVYLAYGRYQQAEDLIQAALEREPERDDLNLKLFEIYAAAQNRTDFDAHAQKVLAGLENPEGEFWEQVSAMGRELSPDNPLYRSGGATAAPQAPPADDFEAEFDLGGRDDTVAEAAGDAGLDFDMDLPDLGGESDKQAGSAEEIPGLEFDLSETAPEQKPEPVAESNEIEFDLGDLNLDSEQVAAAAEELESLEEQPQGDGILADVDEVATKLDLARAYIDMGDPDGARSILDEVMEEGNNDQRGEAQQLIAQI